MSDMLIPKIVASGRIVDLSALAPHEVNAWDIAWGLRQMRYTSATPVPYSVLDHLRLCRQLAHHATRQPKGQVDATTRLAIMLHDAHEAYTGDMLSWLKRRPEMQWYRDLEARAQRSIDTRFAGVGVDWSKADWDLVKLVDEQAYDLEMRHFWPGVETALAPERRYQPTSHWERPRALLGRYTPRAFVEELMGLVVEITQGQDVAGDLFALPSSLGGRGE